MCGDGANDCGVSYINSLCYELSQLFAYQETQCFQLSCGVNFVVLYYLL